MDGSKKVWLAAAVAATAAAGIALCAKAGAAASEGDKAEQSSPGKTGAPSGEPGTAAEAAKAPRQRVVIVGGGFAGISAAHVLGDKDVDITLIDRTNHHVFQPLLYQVALATLAPSDISVPIRWMLRNFKNVEVLMASADRIDTARQVVVADGGAREIPYDYLIVATGARHSYFGHSEWEPIAPGLKTIDDALVIRNRFLSAFEQAEKAETAEEVAAWQTFVVVGGGPTGVELSGLIPEIAGKALHRDYHNIDTRKTRVILVEAGPRLLPSFPESLSARTKSDLEELGVDVRLNCAVKEIEPGVVSMDGEKIAARTVFWAAGNAASPLLASLDAPRDKAGRLQVEPDLSVPGHANVFVVGDAAVLVDRGTPVPGVAPAANQEGTHAAQNVLRSIRGEERKPFTYFNKGNLATIGRQRAIADFGFARVSGHLAWWLWLFIHIMYLAGFRNRLSVLLQWAYAYVTYQRGVRLINRPAYSEPEPATEK